MSASLCLISLAIEKKTSSTFMFVFALCKSSSTVNIMKSHFINEKSDCQTSSTHGFEKLDTILISKGLTFGGRHSLEDKKKTFVGINGMQTTLQRKCSIML